MNENWVNDYEEIVKIINIVNQQIDRLDYTFVYRMISIWPSLFSFLIMSLNDLFSGNLWLLNLQGYLLLPTYTGLPIFLGASFFLIVVLIWWHTCITFVFIISCLPLPTMNFLKNFFLMSLACGLVQRPPVYYKDLVPWNAIS